jgi:hypothetical protein
MVFKKLLNHLLSFSAMELSELEKYRLKVLMLRYFNVLFYLCILIIVAIVISVFLFWLVFIS